MTDKYILDQEGNPKPEPDLLAWARWMQDHPRRIAQNYIGRYRVSTVFLGIDHNWFGGEPILFETMVFNEEAKSPWTDVACQRYRTLKGAVAGHERHVKIAEAMAHKPETEVEQWTLENM